jgi:hypothetical protein
VIFIGASFAPQSSAALHWRLVAARRGARAGQIRQRGDPMSESVTGGCLCGRIRYTVGQPIEKVIACHCTHCQKISGTASSHNAVVPASAFTLTAGTPKRYADTADSGNTLFRHFCADCGSSLYSQREKSPEMVVLKVGTLDSHADMKLVMNIWTKSARPWLALDPEVPQFVENRPA